MIEKIVIMSKKEVMDCTIEELVRLRDELDNYRYLVNTVIKLKEI